MSPDSKTSAKDPPSGDRQLPSGVMDEIRAALRPVVREEIREELRAERRRKAAPQMLEVEDAAATMKISKRHVQTLVHDGDIMSIKIGRCRRIPADALRTYIQRRIEEGARR